MAEPTPKFQEEFTAKLPAMALLPQFYSFFLASNPAFITRSTKSFCACNCRDIDSHLPGKRHIMIEVTA